MSERRQLNNRAAGDRVAHRDGRHSSDALEALEPRLLFSADPLAGPAEGFAGHGTGCCCPCCAAADTFPAHPTDHGHDHAHPHGSALPTETAPATILTGTRGGGAPLSAVPALQSDPGAYRTLYLDFNGQTISNTLWNNNYHGGQTIHAPAFDLDGDIFSFSDAELGQIVEVWQRVAEDFAPFDLNVSTVEPPASHFTQGARAIRIMVSSNVDHASLGGDGTNWYGSAGGVARVGSWRYTSDTPAWVFSNLQQGSAKNVAEAVSHEAGHTLGLSHDGTTTGGAYYNGHGSGATSWGPIMGAAYSPSVSQWSRGEYTHANNGEDDLAVITQPSNGITFRADDHANTRADATLILPVVGGRSVGSAGIITTDADVDYFAFDVGDGLIDIAVSPAAVGANLDVRARLYDASGALLESSSPSGSLGASISRTVDAGRYYLRVEGVGQGDAGGDGYSGYGSLGRYHLVGSIPPVASAQLPPPLLGDVDGDGAVGSSDLDAVIAAWGAAGASLPEDVSGDGVVDVEDLDVLLAQWGATADVADDGLSRYWVPTHGGLGLGWTAHGFDDAGWSYALPGVGYETSGSDYAPLLSTQVPGGTGAVYLRSAFNVDDPAVLDGLGLTIRYDDGFVAYLNGVEIASHLAPENVQWDDSATGSRSDSDAVDFAWFDLTDRMGLLNAGANTLAVHVLNRPGSSDLLLEPGLVAWSGASGGALPGGGAGASAEGDAPAGLSDAAAKKRGLGLAEYVRQRQASPVDALASAGKAGAFTPTGRGTATTPRHVAALLV